MRSSPKKNEEQNPLLKAFRDENEANLLRALNICVKNKYYEVYKNALKDPLFKEWVNTNFIEGPYSQQLTALELGVAEAKTKAAAHAYTQKLAVRGQTDEAQSIQKKISELHLSPEDYSKGTFKQKIGWSKEVPFEKQIKSDFLKRINDYILITKNKPDFRVLTNMLAEGAAEKNISVKKYRSLLLSGASSRMKTLLSSIDKQWVENKEDVIEKASQFKPK